MGESLLRLTSADFAKTPANPLYMRMPLGSHRKKKAVSRTQIKKSGSLDGYRTRRWSPQQESNLYLALRRHSFYPLNYREGRWILTALASLTGLGTRMLILDVLI